MYRSFVHGIRNKCWHVKTSKTRRGTASALEDMLTFRLALQSRLSFSSQIIGMHNCMLRPGAGLQTKALRHDSACLPHGIDYNGHTELDVPATPVYQRPR